MRVDSFTGEGFISNANYRKITRKLTPLIIINDQYDHFSLFQIQDHQRFWVHWILKTQHIVLYLNLLIHHMDVFSKQNWYKYMRYVDDDLTLSCSLNHKTLINSTPADYKLKYFEHSLGHMLYPCSIKRVKVTESMT